MGAAGEQDVVALKTESRVLSDGKPLKKEGTAVDYMYLFGLWNIAYNL